MPSLSPLVVLLLVVASVPPLAASASGRSTLERTATAQATNSERAKMGLLPRRAARSRVTYLSGAAAPGKAAASLAALDEQPVTLVVEDAGDSTSADRTVVVAAAETVTADAPAVATGPVVQEVPRDAPAAAAGPVIHDVPSDAPAAPAAHAAPATSAVPSALATASNVEPAAPPAPAASEPAAKDAREASPTAGAAAQAVAVERVIDGDGEVVVRVIGPGSAVLGERVVGSLVDLPVVSSRRQDDGTVVQTVKDEWGVIEVRRDPVGRFVSATPAEARTSAAD